MVIFGFNKAVSMRLSMFHVVLALLCGSWASAQMAPPDLRLKDLEKYPFAASIRQNTATVFIFLGHECPVTQQYMPLLRQLHENYQPKGVAFCGIFLPNTGKPEEFRRFARLHEVPFRLMIDRKGRCVQWLQASIVPEVFVVDSVGKVLYRGAIDDRFYALGKRRPEVRENYLKDALAAIVNGTAIKTNKTAAIGCFIEK